MSDSKLFNFLYKTMNHQKGVRVFDVDFDKSVWSTIFKEKWKIGFITVEALLQSAFSSFVAVLIGLSFDRQDIDLFLITCLIWASLAILSMIAVYLYAQAIANITFSTRYAAARYFLTVDPKYHATKSSGKIIAKVTRGTDSFEVFLDTFLFEVLGIVGNLIATAGAMLMIDWKLSLIVVISYILIVGLSVFSRYIVSKEVLPIWLKSDDLVKEKTYESVQQSIYIRSLFASGLILKNFAKLTKKHMAIVSTFWSSGVLFGQTVRIIYVGSVAVLGLSIFNLVESGEVSLIIGSSLVLTYLRGSNSIIRSGRVTQRLADSWSKIQDLYTFIRGFGKQSYPVLEKDGSLTKNP
jgi:ABC-type multidrug transport system fused ATPase/permease subunit